MASGFFALLDDIAALMDDVAVMSKVAAKKTAGILGDDLAVNAEKASGFVSSRELPVLWAITKGSFLNKLIILPIAFLLTAFIPWLINIILILGGLFLLVKSTNEIHADIEENGEEEKELKKGSRGYFATLIQIAILDIVFSLDSVITAVGMANNIVIMILAVVIAVGVMMFASKSISLFIENNPTIKILALAFLILVGVTLIAEGFDVHVSKAYIYFAMAFSLAVESINIYSRKEKVKRKNRRS